MPGHPGIVEPMAGVMLGMWVESYGKTMGDRAYGETEGLGSGCGGLGGAVVGVGIEEVGVGVEGLVR
jgi:hypothetical protein